ncbi:uncharacterized protein [Branchiostoma lanceolatum]|uniref:uncharacterized protein n=1 Tax=Branchiostoma lanceolatum TaxID=7740 RepID=UPI003455C3D3
MAAPLVKAERASDGKKEATKTGPAQIRTFVFFDLETTGLDQPRQITEISLAAVRRDQLLTGTTVPPGGASLPRIMDKFTACVRPRRDIHPKAAEITKLTNQSLGKHRVFDEDLVKSVVHLLNRQEPPVCLVAHNGDRFDFPILRAELTESETVDLFPQNVLCADTMVAIKDLYAGQFKSFSLPKIHENLFGVAPPPDVAHTAEGDVITTIKIVKKLGPEEILQWMDNNSAAFLLAGKSFATGPPKSHQIQCRMAQRSIASFFAPRAKTTKQDTSASGEISAPLVEAGKLSDGKKEEATKAGSSKIQTFVFFDLETTGLDQPRQITEISLAAVRRDQLLTGTTVTQRRASLPRIMDKFTACVRPRRDINPKAAKITKLTNPSLDNHRVFDEDLVKSIVHLFNRQEPPVCLVAHNGDRFDFPILRAELTESETVDLFPQDVLCADTMVAIKDLYAGQFKSFSLPKIHKNLFGVAPTPEVAHTAEGDVITTIKIVKKLGAEEILQWMDNNSAAFVL